jgi:hypothetical protein
MKCIINLTALICVFAVISCKDVDGVARGVYNPGEPVTVSDFYPDTGRIAEKVIFTGSNFGDDPQKISVYFNNKKANVISANGTSMYVSVPKMPGDTCTVSVKVGDAASPVYGQDSVVLNKKFRYHVTSIVSTVTGDGAKQSNLGTFKHTFFDFAVDNSNNIFTMSPQGDVFRINEEDNVAVPMWRWGSNNRVSVDKPTGTVMVTEREESKLLFADPSNDWTPRNLQYTLPEEMGDATYFRGEIAVCPLDNMMYTWFKPGDSNPPTIIRIDPATWQAEPVYVHSRDEWGEAKTLAFNPKHPEQLYMSLNNNIYVYDITRSYDEPQPLLNIGDGFKDGQLDEAIFRQLEWGGFCLDSEGICYIADTQNQCIRRIRYNTVETIAGIPGKADVRDGNDEKALFRSPLAIDVTADGTLYVLDINEYVCVRKITFE